MKEQTLMSKFRTDDCMDCAYRFTGSICENSCEECEHINCSGMCLCLEGANEKMKRCPYYEEEKKLL